MAKIYAVIVDQGTPDEYPIGHFTTRELAEELSSYYPSELVDIEETELDPLLPESYRKEMKSYQVQFNKEKVLSVSQCRPIGNSIINPSVESWRYEESLMSTRLWAASEEHARSQVSEIRQAIVSAGKWESDSAFQSRVAEKKERDSHHIDFTITAKDLFGR